MKTKRASEIPLGDLDYVALKVYGNLFDNLTQKRKDNVVDIINEDKNLK